MPRSRFRLTALASAITSIAISFLAHGQASPPAPATPLQKSPHPSTSSITLETNSSPSPSRSAAADPKEATKEGSTGALSTAKGGKATPKASRRDKDNKAKEERDTVPQKAQPRER